MTYFFRFVGAGLLTWIIWATLAADGWAQIDREPLIPQSVAGMIGIGIPLTPGEQEGVPAADRSLDINVDLDRPETNELLLRMRYSDNSDVVPEESFVLTLSGFLAEADVTCEDADSQVRSGLTYDELSNQGRALSVREISQRDTDSASNSDVRSLRPAIEIAKEAKLERFLEVTLSPKIQTSWINPNPPGGSSSDPDETYSVREDTLRLTESCAIRSPELWTRSGPELRLNLPSVIVAELDDASAIDTDITTSLSVDPDTTVIRNLTQPSSQGLPSIQWTTTTGRDSDSSPSFYSGTFYGSDVEFLIASSLSAVLNSSVEAQRAQSQIFLSGIGLGVMATLLVWMASEVFNAGVWATQGINTKRKIKSSQASQPEKPDIT